MMQNTCTLYLSSEEGLSWEDHEAVLEELKALLYSKASLVSFDGNLLAIQIPLECLDFCFGPWFERYKGQWFDYVKVVPTNYAWRVVHKDGTKSIEQRTYKINVHYK